MDLYDIKQGLRAEIKKRETEGIGYDNSVAEKWRKMESMCFKKVDEYK